jgi:hypothetical protein
MNGGVYNGTRILKKETVELMHEIQPGNQIGYGLAWLHETIMGLNVSGHDGDLYGCQTFMLYNQTEDIGVIFFANGNPVYNPEKYSPITNMGTSAVGLILRSLFTKEGTRRGEMQHVFTVSSDPFLLTPLIIPRPMSYERNYQSKEEKGI